MKVAVTGANGFIGSHVIEHFLGLGHEVTGLVRRTSNLRWIEGLAVRLVYGNLGDQSALAELCRNQDVLIHCAARTTAPTREAMLEANVTGTANIIDAARDYSVARVLFLSSQEAVGRPDTADPVRESVPLRPITAYGESKARAEGVVRRSGLSHVILRPGPVYGPRDTDVYLYFRVIDSGLRPILPGPNRISVCSWRSLLSAIECAASGTVSGVYFVSDGESFDWDGLTRAIATAMRSRPIPIQLPRLSLRVAAAASTLYSAVTGSVSIINREKLRMLEVENLTVSIEAARGELGFTPSPTRESLAETAKWYRAQGWLKPR